MCGFKTFELELTRGYDQGAFREDLKKVYRQVRLPRSLCLRMGASPAMLHCGGCKANGQGAFREDLKKVYRQVSRLHRMQSPCVRHPCDCGRISLFAAGWARALTQQR